MSEINGLLFLAFDLLRFSFLFPLGVHALHNSHRGRGGDQSSAFYTHLEHDHQKQMNKSYFELRGLLFAAARRAKRHLRDPPREQRFGRGGCLSHTRGADRARYEIQLVLNSAEHCISPATIQFLFNTHRFFPRCPPPATLLESWRRLHADH